MALAIFIIIIGILLRLLPNAPNFAPVGAIAIFAGIYLGKKWSWAIPVAMMFVSDLFIGVYDWKIMAAVYTCFIVSVFIGRIVRNINSAVEVRPQGTAEVSPRQLPSALRQLLLLASGSLAGSILFFLVTNAAVVFFGNWYPHTFAGVMQSYIAGIPFFRNTVLSDLFYLGIFAGSYEIAHYLSLKYKFSFFRK